MISPQTRWPTLCTAVVVAVFSAGCWPSVPPQNSGPPTTYTATTSIGEYRIDAELIHNHPFLAEYRKHLTIRRGEQLIAQREYQDPGGLAAFYIARHRDRLIVFDGLKRGIELDLKAGTVAELSIDVVEAELSYLGRFMFTANPTHDYRWIDSKEPVPWSGAGSSPS